MTCFSLFTTSAFPWEIPSVEKYEEILIEIVILTLVRFFIHRRECATVAVRRKNQCPFCFQCFLCYSLVRASVWDLVALLSSFRWEGFSLLSEMVHFMPKHVATSTSGLIIATILFLSAFGNFSLLSC